MTVEQMDEARFYALLEAVDVPTPELDVEALIAAADRPRPRSVPRWAAALLLTLGAAGAAYAAPGSPVPGWVRALTTGEAPPPPSEPVPADASGIAVPAGPRLVVELEEQDRGTVSVRFVDGDEVVVEAVGGPASFDTRAERLIVRATGARDYRIGIPSAAPYVELRVGGRLVATAGAGLLSPPVPPGPDGAHVIEIGEPGR